MIIKELIDIWAEYDPMEGYAAGLESSEGRLFIPTPEAIEALNRRIDTARQKLAAIQEDDLRRTGEKILNCISLDLMSSRPDRQVFNCAQGLWCILLKAEHEAAFVATYLENAERLVKFEVARWMGSSFPVETCKACLNASDFLEAMLTILKSLNRKVSTKIGRVSKQLIEYREMFFLEGIDTDNFDALFALFEKGSVGPVKTESYELMLRDLYDHGMSADEIRGHSLDLLDAELKEVRPLAKRLSEQLGLPADSQLDEVYAVMGDKYTVGTEVIKKAEQIMSAVNNFTAIHIQDLDSKAFILPEEAPAYLRPLMTSGATIVLNYLTEEPIVKIYLTGERNSSLLTMLNVLVHEATHAYQGIVITKFAISPLLKLRSYLCVPLSEAMAFYRESELYNAVKNELLNQGKLTTVQQDMLKLFGSTPAEQQQRVMAFEMETRIWRVIRYLRAICDVEVNLGIKSYVEFIKWASELTALSREFIHNECFTFLASPGYTPSYAICGTEYGKLQAEKMQQGISDVDFNAQAARMGFWPWTICINKLRAFTGAGRASG